MKLNDCNKSELIWIVEQAMCAEVLEPYLRKVEAKRARAKEDFCKKARETMLEYKELMEPYEGVDPMKIPMDVLKRGHELLKEVREAGDRLERMA